MKISDLKDTLLDRPSKYQIVLSKFEEDMGWECDIFVDDEYIGGGTSPDQAGAYDLANEIIWDYENPRDY